MVFHSPLQARLVLELQAVSAEVTTLRGLVTGCWNCRGVLTDVGGWEQIESYARQDTEAKFSQGHLPRVRPRVGALSRVVDCAHRLISHPPSAMQPTATPLATSPILVIDDQKTNVDILQRILQVGGYQRVESVTDPYQAVARFNALQPDLVLLDLQMPGMDGYAVLEQLRGLRPHDTFLPIVILTGDDSLAARERALALGATDFIGKPFHVSEVLLRIKNLLETRFLHLLLHDEKALLERRVEEQSQELMRAQLEVLARLGQAAEFRDDETGQHCQRVGEVAARLGREIGLDEDKIGILRLAAPLHDIGKIGIPDRILLKPGSLTTEEFAVMKTHTTIGASLLAGGAAALTQTAQAIALSHHERWDGHGYPHGRAGSEIPLAARLVSLADVYDALTHDRPYRSAWPLDRVLETLKLERERRFEPEIVDAFFRLEGSTTPEWLGTDDPPSRRSPARPPRAVPHTYGSPADPADCTREPPLPSSR